jgi:hypothetical protein
MNHQPSNISADERAKIRAWIEAWKVAGPEMERMRAEDIRRADTAEAIEIFSGMLPQVWKTHPPRPASGLVEQQEIFAKLRHA